MQTRGDAMAPVTRRAGAPAGQREGTYHHVAPLVEPDGQVPVRLHPLRVGRVHDCEDTSTGR